MRITESEIRRVNYGARHGEEQITKAVQQKHPVPFTTYPISQADVEPVQRRRIKAGVSVKVLAEDSARRGLFQNLSGRPVLINEGTQNGKLEILNRGRRFQALSLLVNQKHLAKMSPIHCIVRDAGSAILPEDDSLAENMQRVALHPLNQFRAFVSLRSKGQSVAEIAAAFFVTPQIVKQRFNLAAVALGLLSPSRRWHDAGAVYGLQREPRSPASGSGLGCG